MAGKLPERDGNIDRLLGRVGWFRTQAWPRAALLASIPLALSSDPLRDGLAEGAAAGHLMRRPSRDVRLRARDIRDRARETGNRDAAFADVLVIIRDYPDVEEFQKIAARLLSEMHHDHALEAWLGVSMRFPAAMDAFHSLASLANQRLGPEAVGTIIRARFRHRPRRLDELLAYAEACDLAGMIAERRAAFERIAGLFAARNNGWLQATAWLEEEVGVHRKVVAVLRRFAAGAGLGPPIMNGRQLLGAVVGDWEGGAATAGDRSAVASVRVLGSLFDRVLRERIAGGGGPRRSGSLMLMTGSLGAGGAERQLVNTAVGLTGMSVRQRTLQDGLTLDPVSVVARSLRDRKDGMFFLADLRDAGVGVQSYRDLPDFAGDVAQSAVRPALSALGFLPWSTAEAVIKLTDWLKSRDPAIVHIWQDGLVYAAGLAALLAGVPRIVLSGRSTPPPDRRERYLIEYDIIYRSLLRAPGVTLSVNSRHAAGRYARWLDMDAASIPVVPNGVDRLPDFADPDSEAAFREFDERTGQGAFTLGAVMRLDEVKRPLLWIDVAAGVLARVANARCIIVGDGPFRARAEARADALGIRGRCLFTGRSTCVGFWLSKMDSVMLLSEHEGLPNALIEAQLAGVPVITSPAGGAPETLIPGKTGMVTSATPTPHEVAELIAALAGESGRLKSMGAAARCWAEETFPVSRMLANTLRVYEEAGRIEPARARSISVGSAALARPA